MEIKPVLSPGWRLLAVMGRYSFWVAVNSLYLVFCFSYIGLLNFWQFIHLYYYEDFINKQRT